jgi:hypothetical protein
MSAPASATAAAATPYLVGYFNDDEEILAATSAVRAAGLPIHDCFTPYPVHGLDAAQGLPRSWLTFATFGFGSLGFLTAVSLQTYTQAIETPILSGWPLNVGGKPFLPVPAFVPVSFELTVLFAGIGTALTLLAACRLYPGKKVALQLPGTLDDRFALVLDPAAAGFDEAKARELMQRNGAAEVVWVTPG